MSLCNSLVVKTASARTAEVPKNTSARTAEVPENPSAQIAEGPEERGCGNPGGRRRREVSSARTAEEPEERGYGNPGGGEQRGSLRPEGSGLAKFGMDLLGVLMVVWWIVRSLWGTIRLVIACGKIVVPWACVIGLAVLIGCRDVTRAVVRKMHTLTKPAFRDGCICRGAWGVWSYILRRVGRPTPETAWGPCVRAEDGERLDTARPTTSCCKFI